MHNLSVLLLLLVPLLAPQVQKRPDWPRPHLGTLDQAREESRARNAVLAIFVVQEHEEANDRFRDGVFQNALVAKKCRDLVPLLVNDGTHGQLTIREKVDGKVLEKKICAKYGTSTCDEHQRYFSQVYYKYQEDEALRTPQLILVLPDGKVNRRLVDQHDVPQILLAIDKAIEVAGPGVSRQALAAAKTHLSAARAAQDHGRWVRAWQEWSAVLGLVSFGELGVEATEGVDIALEGMRFDLADAWDVLEAGRIDPGYRRLLALRDELQGTPVAREVADAIKRAEKNPDWKEEIRACRDEIAAEDLWAKVLVALTAGKERQADRLAARILKKYPDTKVAAKVRAEFPHLEDGGA